MFTGIIECLGQIERLEKDGSNLLITINSKLASELKIDQSLAHDGVCLTVVEVREKSHDVIAVEETLRKSTLALVEVGDKLNLERALIFGGRLDGHLVQGHVDEMAECIGIAEVQGSHVCTFRYNEDHAALVIDKGSITVNGISLTLIKPTREHFSVAIIPYTFEHTTFHNLSVGDFVNLEYDIMGKYFARMMEIYQQRAGHTN